MISNHQEIKSKTEKDDIYLSEIFAGIIERKLLVISSLIIGLSIAYFAIFISDPVYKASTLIQLKPAEDLLPESPKKADEQALSIKAEMELIKSRQIIGEAVKILKTDINAAPHYFPIAGKAIANQFPNSFLENIDLSLFDFFPTLNLRQYTWEDAYILVSDFTVEHLSQVDNWKVIKKNNDGYKLFDDNGLFILEGKVNKPTQKNHEEYGEVQITIDKLEGKIQSSYAVSKLNFIDSVDNIRDALFITEKSNEKNNGFIEIFIKHKDPVLATVILDTITDIYINVQTEQKSEESNKVLKFIEDKLPELKEKLHASEASLNEYREENNAINIGIENQAVVDKITSLERQLSEHQIQYAELEQKFADTHPKVLSLNRKIKRIETRIEELNQQLRELPKTEQTFLRLTRDVEVNKELYVTLLHKAQELRLLKAGDIGNIRIIDKAMASNIPISPRKKVILIIGTLLGLFLGITLASFLNSRKGLRDPKEIELHSGHSVFATIPISKAQNALKKNKRSHTSQRQSHQLLTLHHSDDPAVEALRSFRTTLQFTQMEAKNNIIAISGCAPDAGKSFISANLSAILSETGKHVLLIDADLRKGTINHYFKSTQAPGLSELIAKEHDLSECLHSTDFNVDFIPSGTVPPNASTLLMHDNFAELLQQCSSLYDIVLVDTPPILAVTDPAIVSRLAGSLFLVLASGRHKEREITDAVKKFEQNGSSITGLLLNRAEVQKEHRYHYSYDYYQKSYK